MRKRFYLGVLDVPDNKPFIRGNLMAPYAEQKTELITKNETFQRIRHKRIKRIFERQTELKL